jgi:hypothetical protein
MSAAVPCLKDVAVAILDCDPMPYVLKSAGAGQQGHVIPGCLGKASVSHA